MRHLLLLLLTLAGNTLGDAQSAPQPLGHATGTVHTAQVDLGYETFGTRGSALPILAVNGGPGLTHAYMLENDVWQRIAASGRQVAFYDQRGTGASRHVQPGAPQTMEAQVADLEAVRAKLGYDKFALVGDSYGGLLAAAYTAAHAEHVAALVLSDSVPGWKKMVHLLPQVFPDIEQQDEAEQKRLGENTDAAARASLRNHFRMIFYSPAKRDAYMAKMGDLGYEPAVAEAVSKATANLDMMSKYPSFHCSTLVITGRYDMNVAPLTAWNMAHAIPGAKLVYFEESGHLPSYEEPDKYVQVIEGFLRGK
jgi:proline iminopeptidase